MSHHFTSVVQTNTREHAEEESLFIQKRNVGHDGNAIEIC
jgi:hypothetical protein